MLFADSLVGDDRHDVSPPRAPSESSAGGLYKDVFLQITHWANIQKLTVAWQTGCLSVRKVPSVLIEFGIYTTTHQLTSYYSHMSCHTL